MLRWDSEQWQCQEHAKAMVSKVPTIVGCTEVPMTLLILKTAAQAEHKKLHHEIKHYEIICIKY